MLIKISKTNKSVVANESEWKLHIVHVLKPKLLIWFYDDWRLVCWFCQLAFIIINKLIASWVSVSWYLHKKKKKNAHTVRKLKKDAWLENQVNKSDFIIHTIHCSNVIQKLHTKSAVNSIYLLTRRAPFFSTINTTITSTIAAGASSSVEMSGKIHFTGLVESVTFILFYFFTCLFSLVKISKDFRSEFQWSHNFQVRRFVPSKRKTRGEEGARRKRRGRSSRK